MTKHKEKLFDKLVKRDLGNDLEEILINKNFDEEVKNLLLDILYKIENSYKDYKMVKKNVVPQEEYIENIIETVKDNCDTIKFIRPDQNKKASFKIDKENKKIECYPMARKLLYCLAKIQKSDYLIKKEPDILNKSLSNLINVGNNINTVEPLRDFNGFSWDISVLDIENFYYNLIYQDLVILCGNNLLEEWTNKHNEMVDYLELVEETLEKHYGKKFWEEITNLLKIISVLLEISTNKEFKEEIIIRKKDIELELSQMENKIKYLEELSEKKKELVKSIKYLDIIMNDKEKLDEEYLNRNKDLPLEKKIFSKRVLRLQLGEERDLLLEELKQCNEKMNSKNFLKRQKSYKYELKYLEVVDKEDLEKETFNKIMLLQKRMLQAFKLRISKSKTKEELLKIFYELRYFSLIPINTTENISQTQNLKKMLETVRQEAVAKAYELKMINQVCSKNIELNSKIIECIFSLHIIRLEDIYAKIVMEKGEIYVQFYDENIADEKIKIDYETEKKVKANKKIKLFI